MGVRGDLVTGKHVSHPAVMERFTDSTRRAIAFARQESIHRGAAVFTSPDLLAGLGVDENSRAERIGSLKANAFYLRWLVGLPALPARAEESIERPKLSTAAIPDEGRLELDTEARRALGFAVTEADRDGEYWIDSDHLLRGILRFPNRAHFAILKLEIDLHSVRIASKADRQIFPSQPIPSAKVFKYRIRKHLARWVPPILSLACFLYILIEGFGLSLAPLTR
jgi:hypothetical protein